MKRKIAVAITGASGAIYAQRLIKKLLLQGKTIAHLGIIFSENAQLIYDTELGEGAFSEITYYPTNIQFNIFDNKDFYAPFASGSSLYDTLFIAPCSMGTLGKIASGISNDLITRTADVMLKERRKLILLTRESPLNQIHIQNMLTVTQAGGIVAPISPSFYHMPKSISEIVDHQINKVLNLANINIDQYLWNDTKAEQENDISQLETQER